MTTFLSVLARALELDDEERQLIGVRLRGVPPTGYDEAWGEGIRRRIAEIDRGEGALMDWEEFRKELTANRAW